MAAVPTYDLEIDQGDDEKIDLVIKQPGGAAVDLSGCLLWFWIKESAGDPDSEALLSKSTTGGITVTNSAGGIAEVTIDHLDTSPFTLSQTGRKLAWSLQMKDGAGQITTLARGKIVVNRDLIQAIT